MKSAIIFEKENPDSIQLVKAFKQIKIKTIFVDIGQIGLYIENNVPQIIYGDNEFNFDSVFLQANDEFTVFVEPFLSDLVDMGIYCQLKPGSFYNISNRPYTYSILNAKGIKICKTQILSDPESAEGALKSLTYPAQLKFFSGADKRQRFIVDSEKTLRSILKSFTTGINLVTIQEFIEGDLEQSLVIGENVFSIKRKWVEKELSHSKKAISSKLEFCQKI